MKPLNDKQLNCIREAISMAELSRPQAHLNFNDRHDGRTVKSLVDIGVLHNTRESKNRYPLCVIPNGDHLLIKNFHLLNTKATLITKDGTHEFQTIIEGFTMHKGCLYVRYRTGSYYHHPITLVKGAVLF